ncbi:MAG: AAA family ATPase [Candidatus Marinimicrobia bacterium]|jgi:lon-related putative ATP-dependent protease|nr:AAA family ATPase [Candidatus Neomarinimicrobiota bacterium]MBT3632350.1 AAA family ATPase [Candidatus Neomarinimicrobiota bacterium]MBT3825798.1 AAA family ATPase [Candidatus Neomarinimicrobiota bacterium]MBT4129780.1 AAA family ATPase [Candidatus Neomarinimicrobiota bacterium]MBT4294179.1 AAA family ATPase [Candidatus Neomarinimicrobiota bacterium]
MKKLTNIDLCRTTDEEALKFKSTAELPSLNKVIGQERAVRALQFGLELLAPGYNVFVGGVPGTGKSTIVKSLVQKFAANKPVPPDWIVVFNFRDEYHPSVFQLPAGQGNKFAKQMKRLINSLSTDLPKVFTGEIYGKRKKEITAEFDTGREEIIAAVNAEAAEQDIQLNLTQAGFQTIPLKDGVPMGEADLSALTEQELSVINEKINLIQEHLREALRDMAELEEERADVVETLQEKIALDSVENRIGRLLENYSDHPGLLKYLEAVRDDIAEHVQEFVGMNGPAEGDQESSPRETQKALMQRYKVNLLVDNCRQKGAPVIVNDNPSYYNLFGRIGKDAVMGGWYSDYTMISSGAMLRANGGFLILDIQNVLQSGNVWEYLKRTLKNKSLQIEDVNEQYGLNATSSLQPEPIPLDLNVILLGRSDHFHYLQEVDEAFNKTFKVRADFDYEVTRNAKNEHLLCQFIAKVCRERKSPHFTSEAATQIIVFSSRLAGDKGKLSLQFGTLVGLITESAYWAKKQKHRQVQMEDVRKAISEKRFRGSLYEEKVWENIESETLMIDVTGQRIGQINGLAVYSMGDNSFGKPSRITATTYMGEPGIISVEREAKLSGKTYDKGNLIINGFLGQTFAQSFPLSVTITLTFEQSYGGIDGDSASSTEIYVILSALSRIPIKQGIAVTGSVNQWGEIQAIGGVNEKIEGFFHLCKLRGLTGEQGVIIPSANVDHLMILPDIQAAVKAGKFNIWSVDTISEGIEILTGEKAGTLNRHGNFPARTVFGEAQSQLKKYFAKGQNLNKQN